jgi:hypothetical protein
MSTETLENKISDQEKIKPSCKTCNGQDFWLPRIPGVSETDVDEWRCWNCKPTKNHTIIAKRIGPLVDAIRAQRAIDNPNPDDVRVLAFGGAVCGICKCHWVSEQLYSGTLLCFMCGRPIYDFEIKRAIIQEKISSTARKRFYAG